ncbi:MAG: SUMF1/EgtB/PvdO family nonheme iron enzyme [Polyangiaceae bacterium]|jgi:formylglycine-generating enzyme required for sulfatase activity|nr:SUMF1/EgtB/PvdO family nonheme iron enzyme [Polyangiaceae bacterium]
MQSIASSVFCIGIALLLRGCLLPEYQVDNSLGAAGAGGNLPVLPPAPQDCGPHADMVPIPGGYCVDATEVTGSAYKQWLQDQLSRPRLELDQPECCAWNQEISPSTDEACLVEDNRPVVCVDWCDAFAYCRAVGKRLCGKIGGGSVAMMDFADPALSQWTNACTSGGRNNFPYGDEFVANKCHVVGMSTAQPVDVGTSLACESNVDGYQGIFDLSGNVYEWEDSCANDIDGTAKCRIRGGSFSDNSESVFCTYDNVSLRDQRVDRVGFRCCWDPPGKSS